MDFSQGILTVFGGMTSHAAVVARGMGTCGCRPAAATLKIDEEAKTLTVGGKVYHEGDFISIDGSTGNVYDEPDRRPWKLPSPATLLASWAGLTLPARLQRPHQRRYPARHQAGCQVRC